jgi:hypothetical protein
MPPTTPLNNVWGKTAPEGSVRRLKLPSGNECDAERTGLQGIVSAGVLSEGDSLTDIVDKKHVRRVRGGKDKDRDEIDAQSLLGDPEALGKVVMVMDRAMPHIIKNPIVKLHFEDLDVFPGPPTTRRLTEDEREDGIVYTDQVPIEDKMFLFNWAVGGTGNGERFREQSSAALAGVEDGEGVPRPAKSGPRNKKHKPRVRD